ncbi:MAG: DUF1538 family protein, partial [Clostridia bacterium]|nr:DUF1538 family protein [Clostridia bacterium]
MSDYVVFTGLGDILLEVAPAFLPIIAVFIFFQFAYLKLPQEKITQILLGLILSFLGLAFFLQGVQISFYPVGEMIGKKLGNMQYRWVAIPIGALLGFVAIIAEPSLRILTYEVEEVSSGYIPQQVLLYTLPIGAALAVALAIIKVLYQIPLLYILIPGYILILLMFK